MQGHGSELADGCRLVTKKHLYNQGGFGWVTQPPNTEFSGEGDIDSLHRDCISGTRDGVFKLSLPNGTYQITSYFCSVDSGKHKIYLIANDQKVLNKLVIPSDKTIIKRDYVVKVTDRELTQVIYTSEVRV